MTALTQSLDSIPSRYQRLPCLHCQFRAATQSRGLCQVCYNDLDVRHLYPATEQITGTWATRGICKNCGTERLLRARGLCRSCYQTPAIREAHPSTSKWRPKKDDGRATLPMLERYPDAKVIPYCPCGRFKDGECPECERTQRAGMVMVADGEGEEIDD